MPDWSYRTLFRPALFRLPSRTARAITLQAMGFLSRMPLGSLVIRTLGHMESDPILETKQKEALLKYPVGLSGGLDIHGTAHKALSQFGFGFIEIGPVTLRETVSGLPIRRDPARESIVYPIEYENDGVEKIVRRLRRHQGHRLPLMLRVRQGQGASADRALSEHRLLMEKLRPFAAGFYIDVLDDSWSLEETVECLESIARSEHSKPLYVYIPLDYPPEKLQTLLDQLDLQRWHGMVIGDAVRTDDGFEVGREGKARSIEKVRCIRQNGGQELVVIASGGIHQPQDALDSLRAGANYVQLHSGLVYSGPGLPKRINEAIIYERIRDEPPPTAPPFWKSWGWIYLLGLGMVIGGVLAWVIAMTSVMLPYDIQYLCMSREQLAELNHRLLPFMSHDRISLAGTMISIGILYAQLAKYGLRRRLHWAQTAMLVSGMVGFGSFFLYLGHGYFDPLHAAAAAVLLPMFLLFMRDRKSLPSRLRPNLLNDRAWVRAQWGQLMFVILGVALAVGGLTISFVGVTDIFVATDLSYLRTTNEVLGEANGRLLPLIAHDRAGFGGALFSDAAAILAIALWGINQGERWLWWTLLFGGLPGFAAVFYVHLRIGYIDFWHLLPAYFALAVFILGLLLLFPYLVRSRTADSIPA